tara:strand:+ start:222 stop:356 length:135 start_codon:yes stop_codon:yes gene_type:complete
MKEYLGGDIIIYSKAGVMFTVCNCNALKAIELFYYLSIKTNSLK